ncbi:leucine-rich repeat neuronal protein 4 [Colossoma macropomum]|uniref:leucine-rich repeat neuronal protein 4 n=1 Tax=Colossoma macropomum TaxID=42526 RepID=UPI001863A37D|nr:leucine-rich repeat neuronal protein 4 [Colossoma macropomum]
MRTGTMSVAFQKTLRPPLLLSIVLLILPFFVTLSTSSPFNDTGLFHDNMGDYDDGDDYDISLSPATKPVPPAAKRCDYDLCKDQQPSCQKLAATTGCSCPGMSGPHEVPDPPHLRWLSQEGSNRVVVHWCAPASTVTHYLVQVEGKKEGLEAGERSRQMDLGKVASGAEVCVLAVNKAGVSTREKHSCTRFQSEISESGLALRLGILGGVVALLVVLALALLLWRFRARRKTLARTETGGAEGVL